MIHNTIESDIDLHLAKTLSLSSMLLSILIKKNIDKFNQVYKLSKAEAVIVRNMICKEHLSNKEIAATLCLSEKTIKFHLTNIFKKTGCQNRLSLLRLFFFQIVEFIELDDVQNRNKNVGVGIKIDVPMLPLSAKVS